MTEQSRQDALAQGRELLEKAAETFDRTLSPEEYWLLGAGLAACTLAEMDEQGYAVGRIEQLMNRLGYKGAEGDWFQRFSEELAGLNADGLLWPVYERGPDGTLERTGAVIAPSFDARAGYYLALTHLGVALALNREETETIERLAGVIAEMVEQGLKEEHEAVILAALEPAEDDEAGMETSRDGEPADGADEADKA